jgi:hypothetical protein
MRESLAATVTVACVSVAGMTGCAALEEVASSTTSLDCDQLADEAVRISEEQTGGLQLQLLKVRNPQVVTDNRDTYDVPAGNSESLILKCQGMGVWSDGSNSEVMVKATVDSDGDEWVRYAGQ